MKPLVKLYLDSALISIPFLVLSQQTLLPPEILWKKCLGGAGTDVSSKSIRTSDSGFVVTGDGMPIGIVAGNDLWIVKITSTGIIQTKNRSIGTLNVLKQ
jgi:hypothetical protein